MAQFRNATIVFNLNANKKVCKGYLYHLVRVNGLEHEVRSLDSVSMVNEFQDVFLEDLPRIPPKHKTDFCVDLDPNTKPISVPLYRFAPVELKEFKLQLKIFLIRASSSRAYLHGVL